MPTREQLYRLWEQEHEFPETRREDDPCYKTPTITHRKTTAMSRYQKLFDYFYQEHNIILLEQEMQEVINFVNEMQERDRIAGELSGSGDMPVEIDWKRVGENIPTNANVIYKGQPDTPCISCLVWTCYPGTIRGGLIEVVRWDSKAATWYAQDLNKWTLQSPYTITHFCETHKIQMPKDGIDEYKNLPSPPTK